MCVLVHAYVDLCLLVFTCVSCVSLWLLVFACIYLCLLMCELVCSFSVCVVCALLLLPYPFMELRGCLEH